VAKDDRDKNEENIVDIDMASNDLDGN